ncbi:hypothetical protein PCCS19_16950 [Paenibacillus sp. CCS19]|uniref:hypothetical protein n=1 Tax=Paenibacillus sp. CCS19 TaxID=3158387 RepID=UPI002562410A|nr:hypothetical protein [Paenibacillus cellulosilyticus]GMK38641.1 hypothetical protein PCCS19_16950 [Paenibacillus cellulosilyticus]
MLEKLTVLTAFYALATATDVRKLKAASRHGKRSYMVLLLCSLYFSTDYLLDVQWPDLQWLARQLLLHPAQAIIESLGAKHA